MLDVAYGTSDECQNDAVQMICVKCGKCGRKFNQYGFLVKEDDEQEDE